MSGKLYKFKFYNNYMQIGKYSYLSEFIGYITIKQCSLFFNFQQHNKNFYEINAIASAKQDYHQYFPLFIY